LLCEAGRQELFYLFDYPAPFRPLKALQPTRTVQLYLHCKPFFPYITN
jgi:hypothetical protein